MKKQQKFSKAFAVEAVRQILAARERAGRVLTPEEAGKLAKIMDYSGRSSRISEFMACQMLDSFKGEFIPLASRKEPSAPRRFEPVDLI